MPYPLRLLGVFDHYPNHADLTPPVPPRVVFAESVHVQPGDLIFFDGLGPPESLSRHYLEAWRGTRLPMAVFTPGGWWSPDQRQYTERGWEGDGWIVSGEDWRHITVSPSINIVGHFKGWITDGVLSDDVEVRHPVTPCQPVLPHRNREH